MRFARATLSLSAAVFAFLFWLGQMCTLSPMSPTAGPPVAPATPSETPPATGPVESSPRPTGPRPHRAAAPSAYYVAPNGDDANPGSEAQPWRTIQHAAESVGPGDTVYVREGVYHEAVTILVSGSEAGGYITFRNYPGERPVLDGTGLSDPDGVNAFYIEDQSYLIIQGFEIRNYTTTLRNSVPMAIQVTGASHHIQILDNEIHRIETHAPVDADGLGADAHGIAVYGNRATPIRHLLIQGNHLHHLVLGSSEAVVLNGNVEQFTVTQNLIHDTNNIALDFIGFEGTAPDAAYDQARYGVVISNTIYNVDSASNPAYGGERSAGGIYVDGGAHILIEQNQVFSANIGIELASEHAGRATRFITVRNNLIYHNQIAGIAMGGYDTLRGSTERCTLVNNTLYHNDTLQEGNGELWLQFDTRENVIKNNIFYANDQGLFVSNPYAQNTGNVVDYNLYFAPAGRAGGQWQWKQVTYTGFDAYRSGTGNDAHGLFADPQFVDEAAPDLHLRPTSPAINAGENLAASGDWDVDGEPRIQEGVVEMGADEVGRQTALTPYTYLPLVVKHP